MLNPIRESPSVDLEEEIKEEEEEERKKEHSATIQREESGTSDDSCGKGTTSDFLSLSLTAVENEVLSLTDKSASLDTDNFKFNIIEEPVRVLDQAKPHPGTSISGIKRKIPGLVDLTLPATPEILVGTLSSKSSKRDGDEEELLLSDNDSSEPASPHFIKNISLVSYGRSKTRLLDPPPLTPAVKNQLKRCRSSFGRFKAPPTSISVAEKTSTTRSTISSCSVQEESREENQVPLQTNETNLPVFVTPDAPHVVAPGSKTINSGLLGFDEEQDPLDDDSIPEYKKQKRKENKWFNILQCSILLLLVVLLTCSLNIPPVRSVHFFGLNLWQWQALTLVVFCGHFISRWVVKVLVAMVEKHYLLKKRVLYFVYGLRHAVENCVWLVLVLSIWEVIFHGQEETKVVNILTKILWCLFTAAISWMLKILAVKVAANSFHRTAYFDRIQECLFDQYLLEMLSTPSTMPGIMESGSEKPIFSLKKKILQENFAETTNISKGLLKRDSLVSELEEEQTLDEHSKLVHQEEGKSYFKGNSDKGSSPRHTTVEVVGLAPRISQTPKNQSSGIATTPVSLITRSPLPIEQNKLQELTSDTVSAWTLKRLMKVIRNTNMSTYSSLLSHENGDLEINSEVRAKAAAKKIFYNMARPGRKYLMFEDFMYFLPEEQAARAFSLFETTLAGQITKKSLMKWVVGVYKERKALALTLNDNRTVVSKLHTVLNVVLSVMLIIIFFLIFGVDTSKLLVFFSSIVIPSVFVFGNAARTTFESLIFLFVMHPYDVGDRIAVDGQVMLVEEINVLNTILLTASNEKVYYPNSLLALKSISNINRSPDQGDAVDFQIHISTPVEKLAILKERMQQYIDSVQQFWYPNFHVVCKDIEDCNKMRMTIWIQHRMNFQDGGERFQRRSNLLLYLKQQLDELGISYQLPRQEITVTGIPLFDSPLTR